MEPEEFGGACMTLEDTELEALEPEELENVELDKLEPACIYIYIYMFICVRLGENLDTTGGNGGRQNIVNAATFISYRHIRIKTIYSQEPIATVQFASVPMPRKRRLWESCSSSDDARSNEHAAHDPCPLCGMLTELLYGSVLSAVQVCILAYFCVRAGATGQISTFAKAPGDKSTGHYARHLKRALAVEEDDVKDYILDMPGYSTYACYRTVHKIPCAPPQEAIDAELQQNPALLEKLDSTPLTQQNWCKAYGDHPAVKTSSQRPVPIALYLDGVAYSTIDTVIGFWIVNLLSGARHLVTPIRKRLLCMCGCRGWCSFWSIFDWLNFQILAGEAGVFPETRHDEKPWHAGHDTVRKAKAGCAAVRKLALLFIKGDWSEIANTLALFSWASKIRPCFKCNCYLAIIYKFTKSCLITTTSSMYDIACNRAEIDVVIHNAHERNALLTKLKYAKHRLRGGRLVSQHAPKWNLNANDTLEPTPELPDISKLEDLSRFPIHLKFWRRPLGILCKHRNPLLENRYECIAIDALHTLFLGVFQKFLAFFIRACIACDIFWKRSASQSDYDHYHMSVIAIKESIFSFYDKYASSPMLPGEQLTRISGLSEKHLGNASDNPVFKAKAAQTWGVLLWALDIARDFKRAFKNPEWLVAVESLVQHWRICQSSARVLSASQHQALMATMHEHLTAIDGLVPYIPKHHLWIHLSSEAETKGNPRFYDTFVDESINKTLKNARKGAHQCTFEQTVMTRMRKLLA